MTSLDPLMIPEVEQERAPAIPVAQAGARLRLDAFSHAREVRLRLRNPGNAVADAGIDLQRHRKPDLRKRWHAPRMIDISPAWMRQLSYENIVDKSISIKKIIEIVSNHFCIPVIDILSIRRTSHTVHARHVAMYLARHLTPYSMPRIGQAFGGRDHTTILHAIRKVTYRMERDSLFDAEVHMLANKVTA